VTVLYHRSIVLHSVWSSRHTAATVALSLAIALLDCELRTEAIGHFQKPAASAAGVKARVAQLAVQVRLDGRGVTALEGRVVEAPAPVDASLPDLDVITRAADGTPLRQYAIRDPRRQQPDSASWRARRSATTVVYVPMTDAAKTLQIRPAKTRADSRKTPDIYSEWRGGIIQLKPLLLAACRAHRDVPECVRMLQARN
jgi:hypothetical protein